MNAFHARMNYWFQVLCYNHLWHTIMLFDKAALKMTKQQREWFTIIAYLQQLYNLLMNCDMITSILQIFNS